VRNMVLAWLVTLPVSGLLAGLAYVILSRLF
jgi:phosphate/sulfate permease